ncbi:MAG: hypothetical protein ABIH41_03480 [Nanoarchaeota archaeon]
MGRGQVSVEHLFILSLAIMILVPGTLLFQTYARGASQDIIESQVDRIGNEMINTAETVYILGADSRLVISISIPAAVTGIGIKGDELLINYTTVEGPSQAIFFAESSIEPEFPEGIFQEFHTGPANLRIQSTGAVVRIGEIA